MEPAESARFPLHAGRSRKHLRYAKADFLKVCEVLASTSAPDRTTTFLYALGWTQHTVGAQNIRTMAMIQLLLGNMGMAGGGVNALRGHSNIQGLTDLGLLSTSLPCYLTLPSENRLICSRIWKRTRRKRRWLIR